MTSEELVASDVFTSVTRTKSVVSCPADASDTPVTPDMDQDSSIPPDEEVERASMGFGRQLLAAEAPWRRHRTGQDRDLLPSGHPRHRRRRSSSCKVPGAGASENRGLSQRREMGLRLPSFHDLGLSPFPADLPDARFRLGRVRARPFTIPSARGRSINAQPLSPSNTSTEAQFGSTPLLTPPEDLDTLGWNNTPLCATHTIPHSVVSGLAQVHSTSALEELSTAETSTRAVVLTPDEFTPGDSIMTSLYGDAQGFDPIHSSHPWLEPSITATVSALDHNKINNGTVNVVAQLLPRLGSEATLCNGVLAAVVEAIQGRFDPSRRPYTTITYAVPQKFDLHSLPTSPPATPSMPGDGNDYFSHSVFAHAAVVPTYFAANQKQNTTTHASPNPITPPSTIHVSVFERYIPPSSSSEYGQLFSSTGQSALVDRLTELTTNDGMLLFIYPTKTGAHTFISSYLDPVLHPLLMNIVGLSDLSYTLAEDIGRMRAVPGMLDFEALRAQLSKLCSDLSNRALAGTGQGSGFSIVHSRTRKVMLDETTWRFWWSTQEDARIRQALDAYWAEGKKLPVSDGSKADQVTAMTIARQIVDGVEKAAHQAREGIEVAAFVIRRAMG